MNWNPTSVSVVSSTPIFTGVPGFETVLSRDFVKLGDIPAENARNSTLLAVEALKGANQLKANEQTIDYNKWAFGQQNKQNRLRLAGLALAEAFGSGALGGGPQRNGTTAQQKILDQLAVMNQLRSFGSPYGNQVAGVTTAGLERIAREPG